jgi:hypothetical protein
MHRDMRTSLALLAALLAGCGGGGGAGGGVPAPLPIAISFDFALVRADAPAERAVAVANPLVGEASVDLAGPPQGPFAPAPGFLPAVVPAAGGLSLPVVFDSAGGPGAYAGGLRLEFRDDGGSSRFVDLTLRATVEEPRLRLMTPSVDFGNVRIGASATREVLVRNESQLTPVAVTGLSALPQGFSVAGAPLPVALAAGDTLSVPLRYEPLALGSPVFALSVSHGAPQAALEVSVEAETDTWIERQVFDFGTVPLSGGQSDWLTVDVPPHGVSLSLEALSPGGEEVGLNGFEGPGSVVYENASYTGAFLQEPGPVFAATLPNADGDAVQPVPGGGTYRFRLVLTSGSAASLDVRAIVLNRPLGVKTGGVLPLNVFLAPGLGITAAGAPSHARLQALLQETDRIFSQCGLRLGEIDYYELEDGGYDDIGNEEEFGDLLAESAAAQATRLNVFFVERTLGGGVLGVAPRVPGPARNGTRASGIMVDFDFGSDATAGYVTAHEIGHLLGLLHTAESDGSHDLIEDTIECPANGTSGSCPVEGGGYLMHWRVLGGVDPLITAGQAHVVLGHPLVDETAALLALALRPVPAPRGVVEELPDGWCACGRR